jgi:predicted enzyme related to lactoylglutathione lyase
MHVLTPREPVLFALDFDSLVAWYIDSLGFELARLENTDFHYANLRTASGVLLGVALASEMGIELGDRARNSCVLQIEVDDVRGFLSHVESVGGAITGGPSFNEGGGFWFGSIADPEGNSWWVVDAKCP